MVRRGRQSNRRGPPTKRRIPRAKRRRTGQSLQKLGVTRNLPRELPLRRTRIPERAANRSLPARNKDGARHLRTRPTVKEARNLRDPRKTKPTRALPRREIASRTARRRRET